MLMDVSMTNAGGEGLSCEMIALPGITRALIVLWSVAISCCAADAAFHFVRRGGGGGGGGGGRAEAFDACKSVYKVTIACACMRLVYMSLANKTYSDVSRTGKYSTVALFMMYPPLLHSFAPVNLISPFKFLHTPPLTLLHVPLRRRRRRHSSCRVCALLQGLLHADKQPVRQVTAPPL
jgi:hypothetical protein